MCVVCFPLTFLVVRSVLLVVVVAWRLVCVVVRRSLVLCINVVDVGVFVVVRLFMLFVVVVCCSL